MEATSQEIKDKNGTVIAYLFKKGVANGVKFLTPTSTTLQIGLLDHKNGKEVALHKHAPAESKNAVAEEWMYVEQGKMEVVVADNNQEQITTLTLEAGDSLLAVGGYHSIKYDKNTRVIEVKQGPYPGDAKAKTFAKK